MAVEIVYLKSRERKPRGDKSLVIDCQPNRRDEQIIQDASGVTMKIRSSGLKALVQKLESQGLTKAYVRGVYPA
jgi:hypothetical protein